MTARARATAAFCGLFAWAIGSAASAQQVEPSRFSFAGFYAGLNAGVDQTRPGREIPFTSTILPGFITGLGVSGTTSLPNDRSTFVYGGQVGYNHQVGASLVGIELDLQSFGNSGGAASGFNEVPHPAAGTIATSFNATQGVRWLGTARARAGYTILPTLLVYGTGGLAYGVTHYSASLVQVLSAFPGTNPGLASMSNSTFRVGWTIGAGAEWLMAPRWTTKFEYLYYDLGSLEAQSRFVYPNVSTIIGSTATRVYFSDHLFRLGVNYRLN